ncbi:MAG: histidine kinase [Deltaproteobacteria bacterium]|nr:MAG: histidine kinase [Deltaproteobacteria bacterium]
MSEGLDLNLGDIDGLEQVIDREALAEVCRSFFDLFGISIRVFSRTGALLSDVHEEQAVCRYVNTLSEGRRACGTTVTEVKHIGATDGVVVHPCFTGANYRVVPIEYHSRHVGRFVIGPYLPAERTEIPKTLLTVDPNIDADKAIAALGDMPRVREETALRIAHHLRNIVDLILFSSHRAHLTSEMHVASVRESYRELAEKNDALQSAYNRLKELDQLKSNFLATVSHELRTPLTSIIGYSEMLTSGIAGDLNEEQNEFVQTIHDKGDHLLSLIASLLDASKLEQGQLTLNRVPLDAGQLIRSVVTTIIPNAKKKGIAVESQVEEGVPTVIGDSIRIHQILQNLADNALKFTTKGGTIILGARATEMMDDDGGGFGAVLMAASKPAVEFRIEDTGMGIAQDQVERIFDAFYQVDGSSTREHGGAGLGLSIVKRLIEAHGGSIRIESSVGVGTTFFVTIPEAPDTFDL